MLLMLLMVRFLHLHPTKLLVLSLLVVLMVWVLLAPQCCSRRRGK